MEILYIAIAFATIGLIREYMFSRERNMLLDRIMAKDLPQYKFELKKERKPLPLPNKSLTDEEMYRLEQARMSQVQTIDNEIEAALRAAPSPRPE